MREVVVTGRFVERFTSQFKVGHVQRGLPDCGLFVQRMRESRMAALDELIQRFVDAHDLKGWHVVYGPWAHTQGGPDCADLYTRAAALYQETAVEDIDFAIDMPSQRITYERLVEESADGA